MSVLGIDYGEKRVGVAIAHDGVRIASPLTVLKNSDRLLDDLRELAEAEKAHTFVVGLPRALGGHDTEQTKTVRVFARALHAAVPELEVVLQDEAGTTSSVVESHGRDHMLDARAASIILRDYLEERDERKG